MNNNYVTYKKIDFLNLQMLATIGFIIALLLSYLLSYDKKLSLEKKKRLFKEGEAQQLSLIQTLLVFIVSISFLYLNYNQYVLSKNTNSNDQVDFLLQIETSIFAIISALIGLYIVFKNRSKNILMSPTEII